MHQTSQVLRINGLNELAPRSYAVERSYQPSLKNVNNIRLAKAIGHLARSVDAILIAVITVATKNLHVIDVDIVDLAVLSNRLLPPIVGLAIGAPIRNYRLQDTAAQ